MQRKKEANLSDDIRTLVGAIWGGRRLIFFATIFASSISLAYALYAKDIYRSEVLVYPAESSGSSLNLPGGLAGLAGLAGVNIGEEGGTVDLALEMIRSREFLRNFINENGVLIPLFAAVGWDKVKNELIYDEEVYDVKTKKWVREVKAPFNAKPSAQEAYNKFVELISVEDSDKNRFIRVGVEFYSPYIAKAWASALVEAVNSEIRSRDIRSSKESIAYLESQLAKTSVSEMRTIFYSLIEEQTKKGMLAEVRKDYVFSVLDNAIVPERPVRPYRVLICLLGGFVGLLVGVFFVLAREAIKEWR